MFPFQEVKAQQSTCDPDILNCPDGSTIVGRNPDNGCAFFPCTPNDCPTNGANDLTVCQDGSFVARVPPDCTDFSNCPVTCNFDTLSCPDGTVVSRIPPDCLFADCPSMATPNPTAQSTPNPTQAPVTSTPSVTTAPPATSSPTKVVCPTDVFVCKSGQELVRDPNNNCEFPDCDPVTCTSDVFECPDGTFVGRVPPLCEFEACPPPAVLGTIVDVLSSNPDFSSLVTLLTQAGLTDTLAADGPFTVFAPTDNAFAAVPPQTLEAVTSNNALLTQVLLYHVLDGQVLSSDFVFGDNVQTLNGASVTTFTDPLMVNGANINQADLLASNGVIHGIDSVLIPPMPSPMPTAPIKAPTTAPIITPGPVGEFFLLQAARGGCIGRTDDGSDKLVYSVCNTDNNFAMWRLVDETGQIQSKANTTMCMQASNAPEIFGGVAGLDARTPLFTKPCNEGLKLDFQSLDDNWDIMTGGPLWFSQRPDLCVTYNGAEPVIGESVIELLECDLLGGERGQGWVAVFPPAYQYFTLSAASGGCLARKQDGSTELFLKECSSNDVYSQWRLDSMGRFRSKVDDDCMQAAEYPTLLIGPEALKIGTGVFVKSCVGPLKMTYQEMLVAAPLSNDMIWKSQIQIASRPDLCVVHFGASPTVGEARVMLAECATLGGNRGEGWIAKGV